MHRMPLYPPSICLCCCSSLLIYLESLTGLSPSKIDLFHLSDTEHHLHIGAVKVLMWLEDLEVIVQVDSMKREPEVGG